MRSVAQSTKLLLAAGAGVASMAIFVALSAESEATVADPSSSVTDARAPQPSPSSSIRRDRPARSSRARPQARSRFACGLAAGQQFGATYRAESSVALGAGAGYAAERGKSQLVEGRLAFEVLEATYASAVVLTSFVTGQANASQKTTAALSSPFLIRINERCEVEGYARAVDTDRKTARLQQSLVHELWFSVPPVNEQAQVRFENSVGEAFGRVSEDADGAIIRTIHLYDETWSPDMAGAQVNKSTLRVVRGAAPWFSSMRGEQRVTVPSTDTIGTSTLEVFSADYDPDALRIASRDIGDYVWEMLLTKQTRQIGAATGIAQDKRIEEMRDVTFEAALTRFGRLVETGALQEEQHLIMAAYLDAHPEQIDEYSKALASHFPQRWKPPGYAALQITRHPEAKRALLAIYREGRHPPMERVRSSLALSGRNDVGVPVAKELAAVAGSRKPSVDKINVPDHSLMHLGVLAGLQTENEELTQVANRAIESRLLSAQTPQQLKTACLSIANTGNTVFLPQLEEWSRHPNPDMRAHVAIGFRRMPVDEVHDFVVEWLAREDSFRVKREIFEVMQRQYHDADATLSDALVEQTVAHLDQRPRALTRQSIYRLLTPMVRSHAQVRRALRESLVFELNNGQDMAHYVMSILPQRDADAALASIETLRDQYANTNPVPDTSGYNEPSEPDEAPPPPQDMLEGADDFALPSEPGAEQGVAP